MIRISRYLPSVGFIVLVSFFCGLVSFFYWVNTPIAEKTVYGQRVRPIAGETTDIFTSKRRFNLNQFVLIDKDIQSGRFKTKVTQYSRAVSIYVFNSKSFRQGKMGLEPVALAAAVQRPERSASQRACYQTGLVGSSHPVG